jgi:dihydroflavonol-4-reductase
MKHVSLFAMAKSSGNGHARPKVALVTGASGFIGSNLVKILLDEGVKVRALIQKGVPLQNLDGLEIEQVEGDLLDRTSLDRALDGCDTLFHLAAIFAYWLPDPSLMYRVNVEGTVQLLHAAKAAGVSKVIHTSSIAAIGTNPGEELADETTTFNNWSTADHYMMSKYMGELEALRFNHLGLPVVACNPAFPFGAGDIAPTPTGILIQRYASGQNPFVFKGGFNAVHVADVARGHWLAALKGRPGERYILGGTNVTYKQFADAVTSAAGVRESKWIVPTAPFAAVGRVMEWVADNVTKKTPLMVDRSLRYSTERHLWFDIAKAKRELGYEPGSFDVAVKEAVEWFTKGREERLAGKSPAKARKAGFPMREAGVA